MAKRRKTYRRRLRGIRPHRESQLARERRKLSELLGGINEEIQEHFLKLPPEKLEIVFAAYGEQFGGGALAYARRTYPLWQSGAVKMSGVIAYRLLNLVPLVLEHDTRFQWIKRLRRMHMPVERRCITCTTFNWFKYVDPIIRELIESSKRFALPPQVVETLNWVAHGDAIVAHQILTAVEVEEAIATERRLAYEYQQLGWMLDSLNGVCSASHTVELPQGKVEIAFELPTKGVLRRIGLASSGAKDEDKRILFVTCKTPKCSAALETYLRGYEGEPIACSDGQIECLRCGAKHTYGSDDLYLPPILPRVQLRNRFFGGYDISYDCPNCDKALLSKLAEAGLADKCPYCGKEFIVPTVEGITLKSPTDAVS